MAQDGLPISNAVTPPVQRPSKPPRVPRADDLKALRQESQRPIHAAHANAPSVATSAAKSKPAVDPFPYVRLPNGGFKEANPAQALKRERQAAVAENETPAPAPEFRGASRLPSDAPAKEISRTLSAKVLGSGEAPEVEAPTQFDDQIEPPQTSQESAQSAIEEAAKAALRQAQIARLESRLTQLGDVLRLVIGRYGGGAEAAAAGQGPVDLSA